MCDNTERVICAYYVWATIYARVSDHSWKIDTGARTRTHTNRKHTHWAAKCLWTPIFFLIKYLKQTEQQKDALSSFNFITNKRNTKLFEATRRGEEEISKSQRSHDRDRRNYGRSAVCDTLSILYVWYSLNWTYWACCAVLCGWTNETTHISTHDELNLKFIKYFKLDTITTGAL